MTCLKAPTVIINKVFTIKKFSEWTKDELTESNSNNKVVNAMFMAILPKEFKRISICGVAHDALNILKITYEGTKYVKNFQLHIIIIKFEELRMKEDKTFDEFMPNLMT